MVYYPSLIDTDATLPPIVDGQPVSASISEKLRTTILAIETELGVKPSGSAATVRARLDALDTTLNNFHAIVLTNDLGGTYTSPKVVGIQGRPVSTVAPTIGQALVWNGIAWMPRDVGSGGGGGGGGSSLMIGDVVGTTDNNLIAKLVGNPVHAGQTLGFGQNGYALVWNGIDGYWAAANIDLNQQVGGDLGDFLPNPTVRGLWHATVPQAGGSGFTIGNVLQVTNQTVNNYALGYGPLNLGTGTVGSSVNTMGILPVARQAPQNLSGDLSGFTNSSGSSYTGTIPSFYGATVTKIQNVPVQFFNYTSSQDGYILTYNSSTFQWEPKANTSGSTLSGDITGSTSATFVNKLQGRNLSVATPSVNNVITWNGTTWVAVDHSISGDITGTLGSSTVSKIQNRAVDLAHTILDGYVLSWVAADNSWQPTIAPGGALPGGAAGGDLSGFYPAPTVIAINGTGIQPNPVANTVLIATSNSTSTWNRITDNQIQPFSINNVSIGVSAGISGTKISPNFGSQNITTTGTIFSSSGITAPTYGVSNGVTATPGITSGTGIPSTTTNNGSIFLRTDGTQVSALYSYQGGAWTPVGAAATGAAAGDLSGNYPNPSVIAINKNPVKLEFPLTATQDGYVLTWVNSQNNWAAKPSATSQVAGGDLTGNYPNPTVAKVNGITVTGTPSTGQVLTATSSTAASWSSAGSGSLSGDVTGTTSASIVSKINGATVSTAAGALVTGTILRVTGINTVDYGAVNLSNTDAVTGVLPSANQASQSLAGDVNGTTATSFVIKINGASVPGAGSLVTGNVLKVTGTSSLGYGAVNLGAGANHVIGTLPTANQANQALVGDVIGNTGNSTVVAFYNKPLDTAMITPTDGYIITWRQSTNSWYPAPNTGGGGGSPSGAAGGDLGSTYPNPTVVKLQTRPVSSIAPTDGYVLTWDQTGNTWKPAITGNPTDAASGDLSANYPNPTVVKLQTRAVSNAAPTDGYVLTWDQTANNWKPAISQGGAPTGSAGGDLAATYPNPTVAKIQNRAIAATAPQDGYVLTWDQTGNTWKPFLPQGGSPSGSASGDLSGSYPNPTVAKLQGRSVSPTAPSDGYILGWSSSNNRWEPTQVTGVDGYFGPSGVTTTGPITGGATSVTSLSTAILDIGAFIVMRGIPSTAISNPNEGNIYFDSDDGYFLVSQDGYAYEPLVFKGDLGTNNLTTSGTITAGATSVTSLDTVLLEVVGKQIFGGTTGVAVSNVGEANIYYDNVAQKIKVSENGNGYVNLIGASSLRNVITISFGTTLLAPPFDVILCDTTTGSITVLLPTSPSDGESYTIKDQGGNAAAFPITIDYNGGSLIDGATTVTINANYNSITVIFALSSWSII